MTVTSRLMAKHGKLPKATKQDALRFSTKRSILAEVSLTISGIKTGRLSGSDGSVILQLLHLAEQIRLSE